jgi:hypothetical protein
VYLPNYDAKVNKVIIMDGGLALTDGFSVNYTTIGELAGTGAFLQTKDSVFPGLTINVMTNFTGTLDLNYMTVTFGKTERAGKANGGTATQEWYGELLVDPDAVFSVDAGFRLWAPRSVVLNGPMDFRVNETDWAEFVAGAGNGAQLLLLDNIGTNTVTRGDKFAVTINGTALDRNTFSAKVKNGQLFLAEKRGIVFTIK